MMTEGRLELEDKSVRDTIESEKDSLTGKVTIQGSGRFFVELRSIAGLLYCRMDFVVNGVGIVIFLV
jgi:hypothetical protein